MGTEFAFGGAVWSGTGLPDPVVPGSIYLNGGPLVGSYDPATGTLTLTPLPPPGPPIWSGTGLPDPVAPHNIYLNGGPLVGSYDPGTDTLSLTPIPPPPPLDFSGVGITGTVVPTAIILGEGTSGAYNSGTHELTVTSPPLGASGNGITGTVKPIEVIVGTGLSGSWNAGSSALTLALGTPLGALVLAEEYLRIANDTVTISGNASIIKLFPEPDTGSDDLKTINGGVENQVILLRTESNLHDVMVRQHVNAGENIYLDPGDFDLHHNACNLALIKRLGSWCQLFRAGATF
jgi:hypothetical protein